MHAGPVCQQAEEAEICGCRCLLRDLCFDEGAPPALRVEGESRQSAPAGHVRCRSETARAPGRRETRRWAALFVKSSQQSTDPAECSLPHTVQDHNRWSKSRKKALLCITASIAASALLAQCLVWSASRLLFLVTLSLFACRCVSCRTGLPASGRGRDLRVPVPIARSVL